MAKVTIVISSPVIENVSKISPPDQLPVGIIFRWFNPVFLELRNLFAKILMKPN
ncbi:hypothetical protein O53_4107 [Microcystis aeruginosa TAIHU98]|uniref:Uncharacterized protein n=1 Tax=Microcystis aeruginosa TAIHU98 TaxID=1134457 RepID=L7E8S4_MICAE|nr:hypothetical protein O53_4107 [Microcystis aeruginosa TAIHU98]